MPRRYFCALSALCVLFPAASVAATRAGVASRVVTPDLARFGPVFIAGFGNNRRAAAVHDDLYARCLALGFQEKSEPIVICGVDVIGLFWEDAQHIRELTLKKLGRPAVVIVTALHDHQGPDTMGLWGPKEGVSGINDSFNRFLAERASEAAAEAIQSMQPAVIKLAKTHPPELDGFIDDTRPPIVHDAGLVILSAASPGGKPIGTLVNWANHPETLGSKNTKITSDYPGYLRRELEKREGGVAVFINGAVGGMQSPLGSKVTDPKTGKIAPDGTFRKAEIIGQKVADIAADALNAAQAVPLSSYEFREKVIRIPTTNQGFQAAAQAGVFHGRKPMTADGVTTPVAMLRLLAGQTPEVEIALVPGELYPELSVGGIERYSGADFPAAPLEPAIKTTMMSAPYRMIFGLADDEIGYLIPKAEWDEKAPWLKDAPHRWYGEVNSVGPEAAPRITQTLRELFSHP